MGFIVVKDRSAKRVTELGFVAQMADNYVRRGTEGLIQLGKQLHGASDDAKFSARKGLKQLSEKVQIARNTHIMESLNDKDTTN